MDRVAGSQGWQRCDVKETNVQVGCRERKHRYYQQLLQKELQLQQLQLHSVPLQTGVSVWRTSSVTAFAAASDVVDEPCASGLFLPQEVCPPHAPTSQSGQQRQTAVVHSCPQKFVRHRLRNSCACVA